MNVADCYMYSESVGIQKSGSYGKCRVQGYNGRLGQRSRGSGDLAAKLPEAEKFLEFGWSTEV